MAGRFAEFTKADFDREITRIADLLGGFPRLEENSRSEEWVYRIYLSDNLTYIRIFSSVSPITNRSRDLGEDAIRVSLIKAANDRPMLPKQAHVQRITTWATNPEKRCLDLASQAGKLLAESQGKPCRECGHETRRMPSKFKAGEFFDACPNFRNHPSKKALAAEERRESDADSRASRRYEELAYGGRY